MKELYIFTGMTLAFDRQSCQLFQRSFIEKYSIAGPKLIGQIQSKLWPQIGILRLYLLGS